MNRDDIIRMAREAGLTVGTNISGVMLVGSPSTPGIAHIDIDEMQRFAALVAEPLQERIKDLYRQLDKTEKRLDEQYKMGAAAEREACAKVCTAIAAIAEKLWEARAHQHDQGRMDGAIECADAINARKSTR